MFLESDEETYHERLGKYFDAEDNQEKYQKDPLKVLSHFFEEEGFDMEFSFTEMGTGRTHKWHCSIEFVSLFLAYFFLYKEEYFWSFFCFYAETPDFFEFLA